MTDISPDNLRTVRESLFGVGQRLARASGRASANGKEEFEAYLDQGTALCVKALALLPDPDAAAGQANPQDRFSTEELQRRSINAQHRRRAWKGSYPYVECVSCFEQIHVGCIPQCRECYKWEIAQENAARSDGQQD